MAAFIKVHNGQNGVKGARLEQLPPEAWQIVSGGESERDGGAAYWDANKLKRAAMTSILPFTFMRVGGDEPIDERQIGIEINPLYGGLKALLFQISMALDEYGAAYWGVSVRNNQPVRVRWFTPPSIQPDYDRRGSRGLLGFKRSVGNAYYEYDDAAIWARSESAGWLGWLWELGIPEMGPGQSLESRASLPAALLRESDKVLTMLYEQGLILPTIVRAETNPPEAEKDRVLDRIRRVLSGSANAHRAEVFNAGLTFERIGTTPSEMDMTALDAGNQMDVSAVADTPKGILTGEANNRSVLDRLTANWIMYTIAPRAERIAYALNHHVFKPAGFEMRFQPEQLSILQEEEHERSQSLLNLVNAGLPPMVALEVLGYDLTDEQRAMIADSMQPVIEVQAPEPPPPPSSNGIEPDEATRRAEIDRAEEIGVFKRWYQKRLGADVRKFNSDILSHADKLVVADAVMRQMVEAYP